MPRSAPSAVDPVFAEVAQAIYGDVDVREIAKFSPGGSDLHVNKPMTPEQRAQHEKKLAWTGVGATTVATAGGLHALSASRHEHLQRMANAGSEKHAAKLAAGKAKAETKRAARVARVATMKGPAGKVLRVVAANPKRAAIAAGTGWAGLHAVELGADALAFRAQAKAIKQANKDIADAQAKKKQPVAKAFRLRPLNSMPNRIPSLRAKRVRMTPLPANPRTVAGVFQPVRKAHRTKQLFAGDEFLTRPNPKGKQGPAPKPEKKTAKKKLVPVSKSVETDVTWSGEFSKVDSEKRQVFGWASVSKINGEDVVDLQGDVVPIEEIEKSAYQYVLESRKGGDMHRRVSKFDDGTVPHHTADMIESFVVTPEKLEKMGLPPDALPLGWWVGYKVNDDEQWSLVKSGARAGFSIHGSGKRTPVSKMGPEVKDWDTYHALRRKGKSKESAAKIANAAVSKSLKDRTEQAVHPPAVKLHPVKSSAVRAIGYQPQTKRLAVEMHTRPGEPYEYRVKGEDAVDALMASSHGRHFATKVRGKAKRADSYTPADRIRLFIDPQRKGDRA